MKTGSVSIREGRRERKKKQKNKKNSLAYMPAE